MKMKSNRKNSTNELKTGRTAFLVFLCNFKQLPFGFPQTEISNFYFGD